MVQRPFLCQRACPAYSGVHSPSLCPPPPGKGSACESLTPTWPLKRTPRHACHSTAVPPTSWSWALGSKLTKCPCDMRAHGSCRHECQPRAGFSQEGQV